MSESGARFFDFAGFRLDAQARQLLRGASPVPLAPKALDVLLCLVRGRDRILTKEEILATVWPETVVEEGNLTQNISLLRKALGERQSGERLIVTISGRGYRFAGDVVESSTQEPAQRPPHQMRNIIRVAAVAACAVLAWFLWQRITPAVNALERQITTNSSELSITAVALSPDGKSVVYADAEGLHLRYIATGETHSLPHPERARIDRLAWYPDGSKLLASGPPADETRSHVWLVAPLAPATSAVLHLRADAAAAVASPDADRILFTSANDSEIWSMSAAGEDAALILRGAPQDAFSDLMWFPDGKHIGFVRAPIVPASSVESCTLPCTQPAVMVSTPGLLFARLLADGRLVYAVGSWLPDASTTLWQVPISLTTGRADGATRRSRAWTGALALQFDHSANGKSAVVLKGFPQTDVQVAELQDGGRSLAAGHRLTLDDREDYLSGWSPDSKSVLFTSNRSGSLGIYSQAPSEAGATLLPTSSRPKAQPMLSPDGAWLLFFDPPIWPAANWNTDARIAHAPSVGGPPQTLLQERGLYYYGCGAAAANRCVVGIMHADRIEFFELDPARGKGALLATLAATPESNNYRFALSPDGRQVAATSLTSREDGIQLVSLVDGTSHALRVDGWSELHYIAWASNGAGWYVSSEAAMASTLIHVDLAGHATPLLRVPGRFAELPSAPSPDGRYLAYTQVNSGNNVWLIEDF